MKLNSCLVYSLIFVVTFCLFTPFAIRGIDPHHDGLMLKTAIDVLNGQILFKDTFTQYGSLTIYIQAFLMFLFGSKLIVLKLGTVAFYSATAVIQFAIGKKYMPFKLAIFTYIFWLILAPFYREGWVLLSWSSSFAMFFQSLSILFFMNHLGSSNSKWHLFFCGISTSATFWCRVPVGATLLTAYFIIFISCFFIRKKGPLALENKTNTLINQFKYFILGSSLVFLTFFSILLSTHSISAWHYQVFEAPQKWLNNSFGITLDRVLWSLFYTPTSGFLLALAIVVVLVSGLFMKNFFYNFQKWSFWAIPIGLLLISIAGLTFLDSTSLDIFGGWASAIPIILLGFFFFTVYQVLFSKNSITETQIILVWLTIISIASWHQYFPVTCYRHIFWSITPALGPFLMISFHLASQNVNVVLATIASFLMPMTFDRIQTARYNLNVDYVRIEAPFILAGMYSPKKLADTIYLINQTMKKHLTEYPQTPVLLDGGDALYNTFVKNLTNPEAIFVNWGYNDEKSLSKRIEFIKTQRPIIIVEHRSPEVVSNYEIRFNYKSRLSVDSIEVLIPLESRSF